MAKLKEVDFSLMLQKLVEFADKEKWTYRTFLRQKKQWLTYLPPNSNVFIMIPVEDFGVNLDVTKSCVYNISVVIGEKIEGLLSSFASIAPPSNETNK